MGQVTEERQTMAQFAAKHQFCVDCQKVNGRTDGIAGDWDKSATHWLVTLKREGFGAWTPMHLFFSQGSAHKKAPTVEDILNCIALDSNAPDTFEEFCAEFGYDTDSRKAEAMFHTCRKQRADAIAFFANGRAGRWGLDMLEELVHQTEPL